MKKNNTIKVCQYLNPYKDYCDLKEKQLKYIRGKYINTYIDCIGCIDLNKAVTELEKAIKKESEHLFKQAKKLFPRRKK